MNVFITLIIAASLVAFVSTALTSDYDPNLWLSGLKAALVTAIVLAVGVLILRMAFIGIPMFWNSTYWQAVLAW